MEGLAVIQRGQFGQVLVEDEREDGTVVVLTCRPWDNGEPTGVVLPTTRPGQVATPEPTAVLDKYKGVFPLLRALTAALPPKPFLLRIDTSRLPAGPLAFDLGAFTATAAKFGSDHVTHVTIDEANAKDWGLVS